MEGFLEVEKFGGRDLRARRRESEHKHARKEGSRGWGFEGYEVRSGSMWR